MPGDERRRLRRWWTWEVLAVAALVVVAIAFGAWFFRGGSRSHKGAVTGAVVLSNRTWRCRGPVDLALVRVQMHGVEGDAVHLDRGCTGVIQRLEIPGNGADLGPRADGVKVHAGAHDLRVLAGFINCGRKSEQAHQDAIQAMGGKRITFVRISSRGCANAFMFINSGRRHRETPEDVICEYCRAETHNYSVSVRDSVRSGAIGGVYSSRVPPRATSSATSPVLRDNGWHPRRSFG